MDATAIVLLHEVRHQIQAMTLQQRKQTAEI